MTPRSFNLTCIVALLVSVIVAMAFIDLCMGDGNGSFPDDEDGVSVSDGIFTLGQEVVISSVGALTLSVVGIALLIRFVTPYGDDLQ